MIAEVTAPLYTMNKSGPLKWTPVEEEAFNRLKSLIIRFQVRTFVRKEDEVVVFTDASKHAIGGVVFVKREGKLVPSYCASKKLKKHEIGWSTVEKEAYAVHFTARKNRYVLLGREFVVY